MDYIVQADSTASALAAVIQAGGEVKRRLNLINGVQATLEPAAADAMIAANEALSVTPNRDTIALVAKKSKKKSKTTTVSESESSQTLRAPEPSLGYAHAPTQIGANALHQAGIDGRGITVAVIDSGLWEKPGLKKTTDGAFRIEERLDAMSGRSGKKVKDDSGHGTHVSSVIASSYTTPDGLWEGVAPSVNLVSVKAFNRDGQGTYADVISAIDWLVEVKDKYGIRVLNLSISAPAQSHYWEDPLNQAVMAAWQAGIVVVASAGNAGPDPMTIGVPGNVPYIITVGAMTDGYTPADTSDDALASFSSAGPTFEGFVKPEIVAPGGHLRGVMQPTSKIARDHPEFADDDAHHFTMSGTSQAAAVVSGVAALMLQVDPSLTPDDVKCRLMASARLATTAEGEPTYSVFQQGAGLIDAYDAAYGTALGCANQGLDIEADLAGTQHFGGPANRDDQGNFYIMDRDAKSFGAPLGGDDFMWSNGFLWSRGFLWSDGFLWSRGFLMNNGFLWSDGFLWSRGFLWSDSYGLDTPPSVTSKAQLTNVNRWVDQE